MSKIKGIGSETIEDLNRIYSNLNELKIALENGKVPFRNDIVQKLNKYFGLSQ